jgi:fumarate hydratase subunit beta
LKRLTLPPESRVLKELKAGDEVLLSGTAYTMRDAAAARLEALLERGETPPFDLEGQLVFHAGPTPPGAGRPCASVGPTTTARMDRFLKILVDVGAAAILGKGPRGPEATELHSRHGVVYFAAVGGVAALMGDKVADIEAVAWDDLGPEAVYRLTMDRFPAVVAIDGEGREIFTERHRLFRDD